MCAATAINYDFFIGTENSYIQTFDIASLSDPSRTTTDVLNFQ
jgi:hypothetical protein